MGLGKTVQAFVIAECSQRLIEIAILEASIDHP
jgi:hypothetical protein